MDIREFKQALNEGESSTVEFKRCGGNPSRDTYETVCSFANHAGGSIYLGVEDNGTVCGVPAESSLSIERNVANTTGDPQMFSPTLLVETDRFEYEGKTVIRIWVPMNSSVFRFKGQVYDRAADTDKRIDGEMQITQMYIRKQNIFTERRVYPGLSLADLNLALLDRVRTMANNKAPGHPWMSMDDDTLMHSARLYARDYGGHEEGLTLAAALLLGKDDVIADLLPAYKTDAVVRKRDLARYDDRLIARTNLIDSYDQLAGFMKRNLQDRFYLAGDHAVSPRDVIVRELVSNILVHREYSSPIPAQITITDESIITRNASRPAFEGTMDLQSFMPVPKNPIIADFFTQIGLAEELGSGVRNLIEYAKIYSGGEPSFSDGLVFTATVPIAAATDPTGERTKNQIPKYAETSLTIESVVRKLISDQGYATASETAKLAHAAPRTVSRYFTKQTRTGMLTAQGNTRGRKYLPGPQWVSRQEEENTPVI